MSLIRPHLEAHERRLHGSLHLLLRRIHTLTPLPTTGAAPLRSLMNLRTPHPRPRPMRRLQQMLHNNATMPSSIKSKSKKSKMKSRSRFRPKLCFV
ncbi:MAG: hypothetical protein HDS95_00200 [Bacteroidales bacterium]|nr:hypothetical protein [Bacteroidales bacterium]